MLPLAHGRRHPTLIPLLTSIGGGVVALATAYLGGFFDVQRIESQTSGSISIEQLKYSNSLIDRALEAETLEARANALLFYADVRLLEGLNVGSVRTYAEREKERVLEGASGSSFLPGPLPEDRSRLSINDRVLAALAPGADERIVSALRGIGPFLLAGFGISDTTQRLAMFIEILAWETGGFKILEEMGSGDLYEGRLGNVEEGDGSRFKGRGFIMITGRANYQQLADTTGIDLMAAPEMASEPNVALLVAATFWHLRGLNSLADADDYAGVLENMFGKVAAKSRTVERERRYRTALALLSEG
jgi:putative chitinase